MLISKLVPVVLKFVPEMPSIDAMKKKMMQSFRLCLAKGIRSRNTILSVNSPFSKQPDIFDIA